MRYPTLYTKESSRQMVDVFKGYNHNLRIHDGEFFDMKNMTSDSMPALSPRKKRGVYASPQKPTGMISKDSLCYVDGNYFVMNEYRIDMGLNDEPKQLISMGAYVIILPDKKYINTANITDFGNIEAEFVTHEPVSLSLCKLDGSDYEITFPPSSEEPGDPDNLALWIDTSSDPHALKQWSESAGMWVSVATTYVKISSVGIGTAFEKFDGIKISGLEGTAAASLEGSAVVWEKGDDYIVVVGILDTVVDMDGPVTITRTMPEMDFVVESENRLWGCRYGTSADGQIVNEIYASKLGDFKNWNCFMGLSTDSYAASCGTDGQFTGAITHLGYLLFWKEGFVHKIYGNQPSNFQVQTTACRGVQKGCHKSLAIVNEVLLYKARSGVVGYDGSLPTEVSYVLGDMAYGNAVGGAVGNKYYVSMQDSYGNWNLFVYDMGKGVWHKEDDLRVDQFCACQGELYAIDTNTKKIITMLGSGDALESKVEWMAQTGEIGITSPDMKYISRITIRMSMEPGAQMNVYAQYDFSDEWEQVCQLKSTNLRSFSIPIRPKRCDHMKLRIEGVDMAKIYSITKTIEQGSELSCWN